MINLSLNLNLSLPNCNSISSKFSMGHISSQSAVLPVANSKSRLKSRSMGYNCMMISSNMGYNHRRISSKKGYMGYNHRRISSSQSATVLPVRTGFEFDAQLPVVLPIADFDGAPILKSHGLHLLQHNKFMLQPNNFLIKGHANNHRSLISTSTFESLWKEHPNLYRHSFCIVGHGGRYMVAGCCDNMVLVCFFDDDKDLYCPPREALWDLTTNELKFIPQLLAPQHLSDRTITNTYVGCYGFGFDPTIQNFKVLKSLHFVYDDGSSSCASEYIALYSQKAESWKEITTSAVGKVRPFSSPSIYINGLYYWNSNINPKRAYSTRYQKILSFDFAKEKFSHIPRPPSTSYYELVEFHNSLAAIAYTCRPDDDGTSFSFEIWVWDDTGSSWTLGVSALHVPARLDSFVGLFQNDKLFFLNMHSELWFFDCATRELENLGKHADTKRLWLPPY